MTGRRCLSRAIEHLRRRPWRRTRREDHVRVKFALAIADLPEPTRSVFKLICREDLNFADVARQLQISEQEVAVHLARALVILDALPRPGEPP